MATPPPIDIRKHPEFRVIHVNGWIGTINAGEGVLKFYLDIAEPSIKTGGKPGEMEISRITREFQVEVRMPPQVFLGIADWMTKRIKDLEEKGVLEKKKLPEEPQTYRV